MVPSSVVQVVIPGCVVSGSSVETVILGCKLTGSDVATGCVATGSNNRYQVV